MPRVSFARSLARQNSALEHGITAKQEAFAQLVSRGETLSDAYRSAYEANGTANTVNNAASRLMKNAKIRDRIDVLLKQIESHMVRDSVAIRRHVFSGLMRESRDMKAKPGERIQALIALGKIDIVGMFRETSLVPQRGEREPEEVERDLRSKLRELFDASTAH